MTSREVHRKARNYRWEGVEELPYKEDDRALFKSITRQVLFSHPELQGELRYFEVAPVVSRRWNGMSTCMPC